MTLSPNRLQPVAQLRLLRFKVEKPDHKSPVAISCSPVELQFFAVVATRLQNSRGWVDEGFSLAYQIVKQTCIVCMISVEFCSSIFKGSCAAHSMLCACVTRYYLPILRLIFL